MKTIRLLILSATLALLLISGCKSPTHADDSILWLGEANPNPMQIGEGTSIEYLIHGSKDTSIVIVNCLGQEVIHETLSSGSGSFGWDGLDSQGRRCSTGVYYYRMQTPGFSLINKLLYIK